MQHRNSSTYFIILSGITNLRHHGNGLRATLRKSSYPLLFAHARNFPTVSHPAKLCIPIKDLHSVSLNDFQIFLISMKSSAPHLFQVKVFVVERKCMTTMENEHIGVIRMHLSCFPTTTYLIQTVRYESIFGFFVVLRRFSLP